MAEKLSDFDPANMLRNSDVSHIAAARGAAARAKGMSRIAREAGLARKQLAKSLSETGNPTLETMMAVLKAIGFGITGMRREDGWVSESEPAHDHRRRDGLARPAIHAAPTRSSAVIASPEEIAFGDFA